MYIMKLSFFLLLMVILILTHLSKKENFTNVDIPIEEIPFNDSDDIFRKCVNKIKKGKDRRIMSSEFAKQILHNERGCL